MTNLYNNNEKIDSNQHIYDSFNNFIFSNDRNIINKMLYRHKFYEMTKHLHGDIIECGVFKGSGLLTWLKILDMHEPNSIKKVVGFDYFGYDFVENLSNDIDKNTMSQVFKRDNKLSNAEISVEAVLNRIVNANFSETRVDLIQGDITETANDYLSTRPGLRISILYLDMDLAEPTYNALCSFWPRLVPGGVVVLDEYAYHSWSESDGVDRFLQEKNLKLLQTNVKTPTAYIVK
jgi:hypothetical protein